MADEQKNDEAAAALAAANQGAPQGLDPATLPPQMPPPNPAAQVDSTMDAAANAKPQVNLDPTLPPGVMKLDPPPAGAAPTQMTKEQEEDTVTMFFPKQVKLTLDGSSNQRVFPAGIQEVPAVYADHWYLKASGATRHEKKPAGGRK